jgi:hypothetical protein
MATSNKRGFVPARSQTGGSGAPRSKLYSTDGNQASPLFVGDPVALTGGYIVRLTSALQTSFLGIVRGVYDSNKKPKTHSLPAGGNFIAASAVGYADVVDDPDMTFIVDCEVSVSPSAVGKTAVIGASGGNTATGISRFHIVATNGATASATFRIVGIAPTLDPSGTDTGAGQDIEVIAINHVFK